MLIDAETSLQLFQAGFAVLIQFYYATA